MSIARTVPVSRVLVSESNVTVTANSVSYGAGLAVTNYGSLTLHGCTVTGNTASHAGGAIEATLHAVLNVSDSTIAGNEAGTLGGAIYAVNYPDVTLTRSTVDNNHAASAAGMWGFRATWKLVDSVVSRNTATTNFGGVYGLYDTMTFTNTTIAGNGASNFGGGVFAPRSAVTLVNSTVSGNSASTSAGVGGNVTGGSATNTIALRNTIVAGNTGGGGDCYDGAGTATVTAANSLFGDATSACGFTNGTNGNIVGQDPLLVALANNGGPTWTMALGDGSPALGAGNVGYASVSPTQPLNYDQRGYGYPRVVYGAVDMGAWQRQPDGTILVNRFEPEP